MTEPTARVEIIAVLAQRFDLLVLAGEIHAPLTLPGHAHVPFGTLGAVAEGGARGPRARGRTTRRMTKFRERVRFAAPGGRPQPLAFHGETLYVGARDTERLYGIEPSGGRVVDEVALPGPPFGLVSHAGELHVVVADAADDRFLYRYRPGQPFATDGRVELPEGTGSTLASDGRTLYLVQAHNMRIVALAAGGTVERSVTLPTRLAGACFRDGTLYAITADEDFEQLELATLGLEGATASSAPLAPVSSEARGLAYGAGGWWTNYRERNEIVALASD